MDRLNILLKIQTYESGQMHEEGRLMKFYTIKLPRFLGGIIRAVLGTFNKK